MTIFALIASVIALAINLFSSPILGTVNQTQLSDTINTFRTNVNSDLFSIDRDLRYTTTTDPGHKHTTTTITGIFGLSAGGTGTSTVPTEQFLSTNGSVPTWKFLVGSGGVTVSTTTTSTIISSTAFDASANYTWTGGNIWNSSSTFNSTTTLAGITTISGNATFNGTMAINGNVTVAAGVTGLGNKLYATTTNVTINSGGTETTIFSFTLPTSTLGTDNVVRATCYSNDYDLSAVGNDVRFRLKYGAVTVVTSTVIMQQNVALPLKVEFQLGGDGSTSAQWGGIEAYKYKATVYSSSTLTYATGTSAQNSATALTLSGTAQIIVVSGTPNLVFDKCYVEAIVQ